MPTKIVSVISGKGGVGKTTLVSNLSYILSNSLDRKVVAVDSNFTSPDLSLQLGIYVPKYNLGDVLRNSVNIRKSILPHHLGFSIIPGSLTLSSLLNYKNLDKVVNQLVGEYDYIIIDSPAGLGNEVLKIIDVSDEVIIITNPEIPSLANAVKSIRVCEKFRKEVSCIVVNRIKSHKYEVNKEKIFSLLDFNRIFFVPEDKTISKSIKEKVPASYLNPRSLASIEFHKIANFLDNKEFLLKGGFFDRLLTFINGLF